MNLPRLPRIISKLSHLLRKDGGKFATIKDALRILPANQVITHEQVYAWRKLTAGKTAPQINSHLLLTLDEIRFEQEQSKKNDGLIFLVYCIGYSHKQLFEIHGMEPKKLSRMIGKRQTNRRVPCYMLGTNLWIDGAQDQEWFTAGAESGYRLINFKPFFQGASVRIQQSGIRALQPGREMLRSNVLVEALFNIELVTGKRLLRNASHREQLPDANGLLRKANPCLTAGPFMKHGMLISILPEYPDENTGVVTHLDPRHQIEMAEPLG